LKVVIIGPAYPLRGGLASYNQRLALEYSRSGNEVWIETFSLQYPNFLFPGTTQYSNEEAPKDISIAISINSINPFNWLKVGLKLKKIKPDILIIRYWLPFMAPCLGTIARITKSNHHTKVISITDNIIPHEKRIGDTFFSKYFVRSVDAFLTMSKVVLNDLEKFDKKKPKLFCFHPLYDNFGPIITKEQALQKLGLKPDCSYLLFFGFIRDYKGLDLLLEAFKDERLQRMNLKLIIAGEYYSDSQKYLDLIKNNGLEEKIIQKTDFIPDSEVVNYFCAADMIVQPYKSATQSGVTQICYHFEKPMLVTNVGGLAEIVLDKKVGYVVEPNAISIANALVDFYQNQREMEFSKNTILEKRKYSWSNLVATIQQLVEKL
jgi:glycosyltransferase involved in cell wall biosynthesis